MHGGIANDVQVNMSFIESDEVTDDKEFASYASGCDGILIPGGFGKRGFDGKLLAAKFCRENNIPYLGICLGMHVLVVEFARNVLGLKDANSTEFSEQTTNPVISLLSEQKNNTHMGGTMRLGSYPCELCKKSKSFQAYHTDLIHERHRHRYEFNNDYKEMCEQNGMKITGILKHNSLCEIVELENHKWMVGVQFHPEFKSTPVKPHPLFVSFIKAASNA